MIAGKKRVLRVLGAFVALCWLVSCGGGPSIGEDERGGGVPWLPMHMVTVTANYTGQDGKTVYAVLDWPSSSIYPRNAIWSSGNERGSGVLSDGTVTFNLDRFSIDGSYELHAAIDLNDNWDGVPDGADLMAGPTSVNLVADTLVTVNQADFKAPNVTITINHTGASGKRVYATIVQDGDTCQSTPVAVNYGIFPSGEFLMMLTMSARLSTWMAPMNSPRA